MKKITVIVLMDWTPRDQREEVGEEREVGKAKEQVEVEGQWGRKSKCVAEE